MAGPWRTSRLRTQAWYAQMAHSTMMIDRDQASSIGSSDKTESDETESIEP